MPFRPRWLALQAALLSAPLLPAAGSAHVAHIEVAGKKLSVESNAAKPQKNRLSFETQKGHDPLKISHDPTTDGFRVLVVGEGGGGNRSALATLDPGRWKALKNDKGWKYKDKDGTRGGITEVPLDKAKARLTLRAKGEGFGFAPTEAQDEVWVHVNVEDEWFCARFGGTIKKNDAGVFKARGAAGPGAWPPRARGN